MNKILKEKIIEAFKSVLPITIIVLIASIVLTPMPSGTILMFLAGAALLIIGMGFFTLGADMALMPMGEGVGVEMTKKSNLLIIILVTLIIGFVISVAEPDLWVLAEQTHSIHYLIIIGTVSIGVAIFMMIGVLRTLFKIRFSLLVVIFYFITFGIAIIAFLLESNFISISFDSGGVTTGPITVPFMLALGLGVASIRSDKNSQEDSFGIVAMCSVGPILAMLILGLIYKPGPQGIEPELIMEAATSRDVAKNFIFELPRFIEEMSMTVGALGLCFIVFQLITRRFKKHQLGRIVVGFLYTLLGLVLFLTGVSVGFLPVGKELGFQLASSSFRWILIPLGALMGYLIVAAEPAVHVLNKQVEEVSSGAITQKMMNRGLSIGMAAALALAMIRILFGIPILYMLIPGYLFALALTFFVPRIFTSIAFDSGGVASGPMSSTFLLPFAMGTRDGVVMNASDGNLIIDAFGIVAIVAMTPLVVIQLMGLIYKFRTKQAEAMTIEQTAAIGIGLKGEAIDWGKITVLREDV